jgi:hypothetical protein
LKQWTFRCIEELASLSTNAAYNPFKPRPWPYLMLLKKITIYLTVDEDTIDAYFNAHDPSPMYKRQLNQDFEEYIMSSIVAIKRYSVIRYKLVCKKESDKKFVEPLVFAVRRHFSIQKSIKESQFIKFKKSSYKLLAFSLTTVVLCHFLLSAFEYAGEKIHSLLQNGIEVFSWVILWKPINELVFNWNPFLKEISVLNRLINADIITSEMYAVELPVQEQAICIAS